MEQQGCSVDVIEDSATVIEGVEPTKELVDIKLIKTCSKVGALEREATLDLECSIQYPVQVCLCNLRVQLSKHGLRSRSLLRR